MKSKKPTATKWIPLDCSVYRPEWLENYAVTDGKSIWHEMYGAKGFSGVSTIRGWVYPTHWARLPDPPEENLAGWIDFDVVKPSPRMPVMASDGKYIWRSSYFVSLGLLAHPYPNMWAKWWRYYPQFPSSEKECKNEQHLG